MAQSEVSIHTLLQSYCPSPLLKSYTLLQSCTLPQTCSTVSLACTLAASLSLGGHATGLGHSLCVLLIHTPVGVEPYWDKHCTDLMSHCHPQTGVRYQVQEYGLTLAVHLTAQRVIQSL